MSKCQTLVNTESIRTVNSEPAERGVLARLCCCHEERLTVIVAECTLEAETCESMNDREENQVEFHDKIEMQNKTRKKKKHLTASAIVKASCEHETLEQQRHWQCLLGGCQATQALHTHVDISFVLC